MSDDLRQSSGSTSQSTGASTSGTGMIETAKLICGCPEPGPETIEVEQVLGAEMKQKVVEFDMIVPSQKPDIEQVVDVYVKNVEINSVDVINDKVIIRGDLEVKVMYVADLPSQPVHAFEKRHIRFTRDIVVDGAEPGMDASADVTVEYVDYDFESCHDKRKVHVTIVLKFWARVMSTTKMDVYALGPVTEVGQVEVLSASAANGMFGGDATSASQTGGGDTTVVHGTKKEYDDDHYNTKEHDLKYNSEDGLHYSSDMGHMSVTGPGITPTAGTTMGASGTGTINGTGVNVRTGPGTNFPIVSKIEKGTKVTIKEQAFGWYKVVFADGKTGWIASWLINTGSGTVPPKPKG